MSEKKLRFFKVWNDERTIRKSLSATDFSDLFNKVQDKLGFSSNNFIIVLEEDGTEIDDDDYLSFISDGTVLMSIPHGKTWRSTQNEVRRYDETDSVVSGDDKLSLLASRLRSDISLITSFSRDDYQMLANADTEVLAERLHSSLDHVQCIQKTCLNHLDSFNQTNDAINLLKLYDKSNSETQHSAAKIPKIP